MVIYDVCKRRVEEKEEGGWGHLTPHAERGVLAACMFGPLP